jgi:spermidine synthase
MLVHPALSFAPKIDSILILGGGDGMAAREILKYKEVKKIVLVDLDSEMTNLFKVNKLLTKFNKNSLTTERVSVINQDAFLWLYENKSKFDVVVVDFPDPSNYSVGKLYSKEFYMRLKKNTKPTTICVIQSTSPFFAPKSFWCINETVKSVFGNVVAYHVYLPSFGEWGFTMTIPQKKPLKYRNLINTRFYDHCFDNYTHFQKDMTTNSDSPINRINNQELVKLFNQEWSNF